MATPEEAYDDAMFDFSQGELKSAIDKLQALLATDANYFDAQLSLGMAYFRLGDYPRAIAEGHRAEQLSPKEQLVHTNLSLFYMKAGDKVKAEHHGLQARIASWRDSAPPSSSTTDTSLEMAKPEPSVALPPPKFPEMPWKKKATPAPTSPPSTNSGPAEGIGQKAS